jgi:hypothetical protein
LLSPADCWAVIISATSLIHLPIGLSSDMRFSLLYTALSVALLQPAQARDFRADRPGIDTPPCTVEPGRLNVEVSLADWTPESLTATYLIGDLALRYGIADHAELRLSWTAFGHLRARDRLSGAIDDVSGAGDIVIGIKRNLIDPDGKAFSVALNSA